MSKKPPRAKFRVGQIVVEKLYPQLPLKVFAKQFIVDDLGPLGWRYCCQGRYKLDYWEDTLRPVNKREINAH